VTNESITEARIITANGFTVTHYDTLHSTQIAARSAIENNPTLDQSVITTAVQTAGYGRRGRAWAHQSGNVYMTLIRRCDGEYADHLPLYGFIASLAIADTCRHFLAGSMAHVVIKWPNDVLVNDAKIAGILLERVEHTLLLGMGVNLVTPDDVDQIVTGLDQFMQGHIEPTDFVTVFLKHFVHYETMLREQGFAALRHVWLEQAKGQGQEITARLANGTILHGIFLDLDHHGAMLLDNGDGTITTITSADIFFNEDV
jgi:BirA family biotin operon repressor/biotin-[acetyl-CoA-carboxylase] ligase